MINTTNGSLTSVVVNDIVTGRPYTVSWPKLTKADKNRLNLQRRVAILQGWMDHSTSTEAWTMEEALGMGWVTPQINCGQLQILNQPRKR